MKALLVICIIVIAGYSAKTPYSALIEHPSINKIKARSWGKILISYADLKSSDPQFKRIFDFLDKFEALLIDYKDEENKKYSQEVNSHETLLAALNDELTGAWNTKYASEDIIAADEITLGETISKIEDLTTQIANKEQELADTINNRMIANQLYLEKVAKYNDVLEADKEVIDLLNQMKVPDQFTFAQIESKSQSIIKRLEKGATHLDFKGSKKAEFMLLIATIKKIVKEPEQKGNKYIGQVIDLLVSYGDDIVNTIAALDETERIEVSVFEEYKISTNSILDDLRLNKENNLNLKSNLETEIATNKEIVAREEEHITSLDESIKQETEAYERDTLQHNILSEEMDGDLGMIAEARQILAEANITPY